MYECNESNRIGLLCMKEVDTGMWMYVDPGGVHPQEQERRIALAKQRVGEWHDAWIRVCNQREPVFKWRDIEDISKRLHDKS